MSTRFLMSPYAVIPNAGALPANTGAMAANIISLPSIILGISKVSYQVVWSASTAVGAISVQGSNTYSLNADGSVKNAGAWDTLTFDFEGSPVMSIPVTGTSGSGLLDITATAIYAIRVVYMATSGDGTITAVVSGKV